MSDFKPTDDELGNALIDRWGENVRYLYGAWHEYQGGVWRPKKRATLDFWQIMIDHKDQGIRPSVSKAKSIEAYCRDKMTVEDDETRISDQYINMRNGLYNLTTRQLEAHRPDLYATYQLDFEYDYLATCPLWERFLDQVMVTPDGKPDLELKWALQEAFYYSLTASTEHRLSFWLVGPTGTGKSTVLNVLLMLAGDSHVPIDLETLATNTYQMADVAGKRVVTFTEPDARVPLADGAYKKLVSKDSVPARQIHGRPFSFVPICKVWGAMNKMPRVWDRSGAVFDRILIFPMTYIIPKAKRDGDIEAKFREELPGIFNWAMLGGNRLRVQKGFTRPGQSETARQDYQYNNDIEYQFIDEEISPAPEETTAPLEEVFKRYKTWCEENGYKPKGKAELRQEMARLGYPSHRKKDGWHIKALSLKRKGWL